MNIEHVSIPGGWIAWEPDGLIQYLDKNHTLANLHFQVCFDSVTGEQLETGEYTADGLKYAERFGLNEARIQLLESLEGDFLDQAYQDITDSKALDENQLTLPPDKQPLLPWLVRRYSASTCNYIFDPHAKLFLVVVVSAKVEPITNRTTFLRELARSIADLLEERQEVKAA